MNGLRSRRVGHLRAIALLAFLILPAALPLATEIRAASPDGSAYEGMSLAEALLDLRSRGLKIVFTTEVVRPEMVVTAEPVTTEPRQILDEILEPHGLMVRDGPRDTLVVVRRASDASRVQGSIGGSVRFRADSSPVPGAVIQVVESGAEATSAADGTFFIPEHDAGSFTLVVGREGFRIERVEGVAIVAGEPTEITVLLDPAPVVEEAIVITPSRVSLLREEPGTTIGLSRQEILALPHLGDDFFRALSLLSGISANDVSAQFHVRGGRRDETQILIDGQELYEAYHLKDFDSALSFVAASTLDSADLSTGGFSAEFGDRMSGVLDMTTVSPSGPPRGRVGVSVFSLQAGGAGGFHDDRGSWMAELRRGTIDLVEKLFDNEDPQYGDAYAKMEYQFDGRNSLRFNLLYTNDEFRFEEVIEDESKRIDTGYQSAYFWMTHRLILGSRSVVETALSLSSLDQDRRGVELEEEVQFVVRDERDTEVLGIKQDWSFLASHDHFLRWGIELREFVTGYDYFGSHTFDNPLADIRDDPEDGTTIFRDRFEEDHNSLYVADRVRLAEGVRLELGLRYDRYSLTDEDLVSPRVNLAFSPDDATVFRFAWGHFNQSQRPYELQVEDGEEQFYSTEQSEHLIVGIERVFAHALKTGPLAVRAEVYQREVDNPRPRYENLYEALNTFPEVEPDRVRIDPDSSLAEGVELFVQGRASKRLGWFANYAYASTEDEIMGTSVPRAIDQRHTLNVDLDYRAGQHWHLNFAFRYHTGWPTTPISLEEEVDEDGETVFVPVLGPLNSKRLPDYHRLDLRASREFRTGGGRLFFFVDIQNVFNRKNTAGFDIAIDEEEGTIVLEEEPWAGILPSVGIVYEF
jgi:outer membrane receptor protein involved in Fe transport